MIRLRHLVRKYSSFTKMEELMAQVKKMEKQSDDIQYDIKWLWFTTAMIGIGGLLHLYNPYFKKT